MLDLDVGRHDEASADIAKQMLADWIDERFKSKYVEDHDLIVMGDFNVPQIGDKFYKALTSRGLWIPHLLRKLKAGERVLEGMNFGKSARYDHAAGKDGKTRASDCPLLLIGVSLDRPSGDSRKNSLHLLNQIAEVRQFAVVKMKWLRGRVAGGKYVIHDEQVKRWSQDVELQVGSEAIRGMNFTRRNAEKRGYSETSLHDQCGIEVREASCEIAITDVVASN